ncbi:MAG: protein kinase [Anaerolineales bacterium]
MEQKRIGRYEIIDELGRGGMATVYRANDPRFEREVALKVLPRELLHDPQFKVRFEREAKTIAMLEHPFIVPVYDFGEEDGQPYFVMRYMTGGSLADRIREHGTLTVAQAARIMEGLCSALDEAHKKGIIHRDLKPANILFDRAGEPCVSDFGIAKITQSQTNVTAGAMIGTPAYMSPEQAQGETVDARSDIYALGIILFEMLTGRQPYEADTPMGVAVKHITEPVPHILDIRPDLPPGIETIIEKAMAKDREARFQTAGEFSAALTAVAHGMSGEEAIETAASITGAGADKTYVQAAKTRIGTRPITQPGGRAPSQPVSQPVGQPAAQPAPKKTPAWLWAVIGVVALCLVGGIGVGGFLLSNLPGGESPTVVVIPTFTATAQPVVVEAPTATPEPTQPVVIAETPTAEAASPTPEPATQTVAIGGADMMAFLRNNDIWIVPIAGGDPQQLTIDRAAKSNLQWLPDGKTLLYTTGTSVRTVNIETQVENIIAAFPSAQYLDEFRVSPDGKQVAISLNRELFVVPFDIANFSQIDRKSRLLGLDYCIFFDKLAVKNVRWSPDGKRLAVKFLAPKDGQFADTIRVVDISRCREIDPPPRVGVEFPGPFFGFANVMVNYSWDGESLFFFNSNVRNDGFGDIGFFNAETRKFRKIAPIENTCCYRDVTWSPDGRYVAFAFQDVRLGANSPIKIYYVDFASLTAGGVLTPLPLPQDFFTNLREQVSIALRPAQP